MKIYSLMGFAIALPFLHGCSETQLPTRACNPPRDYWQKPHFIGGLDNPFSQVSIDHNSLIYFDGRPVTAQVLQQALSKARTIDAPRYDVFLEAEMGASCKTLEETRDQMDKVLSCRQSGRCAEGSRTVWRYWPLKAGDNPG